jgi:hypothetical protein
MFEDGRMLRPIAAAHAALALAIDGRELRSHLAEGDLRVTIFGATDARLPGGKRLHVID